MPGLETAAAIGTRREMPRTRDLPVGVVEHLARRNNRLIQTRDRPLERLQRLPKVGRVGEGLNRISGVGDRVDQPLVEARQPAAEPAGTDRELDSPPDRSTLRPTGGLT